MKHWFLHCHQTGIHSSVFTRREIQILKCCVNCVDELVTGPDCSARLTHISERYRGRVIKKGVIAYHSIRRRFLTIVGSVRYLCSVHNKCLPGKVAKMKDPTH